MSSTIQIAPTRPTPLRILDEAEQLFAERGYRATSLAEIADRVGIRGPSLFNHFANKRALYEAVLGRLLTPFFDMLKALGPDAAEGTAPDAVARMFAHHAAHPRLACLIQHAVLEQGEQLDWLVDGWYRPFFASLPHLKEPGGASNDAAGRRADPTAVTMAFNSLILGYVALAPLHRRLLDLDPLSTDAVDRYAELLRSGSIRAASGADD